MRVTRASTAPIPRTRRSKSLVSCSRPAPTRMPAFCGAGWSPLSPRSPARSARAKTASTSLHINIATRSRACCSTQGVKIDAPGVRNGRTAYLEARLAGHQTVADYLLQHGATPVHLDANDRFAAECAAGRRDEARALLRENPALLEQIGHARRVELLLHVVEAGRPDALRFMSELGFDLNGMVPGTGFDRSPLHQAAYGGHLEMVKLLLDLGADPNLRDPTYNGRPLNWAEHNQQQHVVDYLRARTRKEP